MRPTAAKPKAIYEADGLTQPHSSGKPNDIMRCKIRVTSFFVLVSAVTLFASACTAQEARPDLYRCEGCEAIYERSFDDLSWKTTISSDNEPGEPFILSGTVYQVDGTTPAEGVIVYAYHTNAEGVYPTRGDESGWGRRHGYLRGWVTSNEQGRYAFRTIRPATYPSRTEPAHIHMIVKEPDRKEYWIDAVMFEGDPLLEEEERGSGRGGPGIVKLDQDEDGTWRANRDIVLERHPE